MIWSPPETDFQPDSNWSPPEGDFSSAPIDQKSIVGKAWDALAIPEQMSHQGYQELQDLTPSDVQVPSNIPGVGMVNAKQALGVIKNVAPGFVSRGAMVSGVGGKLAEAASEIPAIQKIVSDAGSLGAKGIQAVTGIPAENTEKLFANPLSFLTNPTQADVRSAYANSEIDDAAKTLAEKVDAGTLGTAKKVRLAGKELLSGESPDPTTLLKGRKALDAQIGQLQSQLQTAPRAAKSAIQNAIDDKLAFREEINKALDVVAPNHRAADAIAAKNFDVAPFRQLTLPGKINFISPTGIARAIPGLPSAIGAGVGGMGLLSNVVSNALPAAGMIGYSAGALMPSLGLRPRPGTISGTSDDSH